MKTRNTLFGILSLIHLLIFAQTAPQTKNIGIEWLSGGQPKLLSSMANSPVVREELNGTSLSLGTLLGGWHAQAIGQYGDFVYVAFSDGKLLDVKTMTTKKDQAEAYSKLWIYNLKTKQGQLKDLVKGYAHPCSIQVTGKYLTIALEAAYGTNQMVGIERNENSLIQIYDLEQDPYCSVEAGKIVQDGMNSGGAGLAYHPLMKCWYMLVDQDTKDGKVAVYKTENQNINSWIKIPIAKYPRYGSGAGLNLLTASDNSIWGFYFDTAEDGLPAGSNWMVVANQVKMFKLVEADGKPVQKREVISQIVSIGAPLLKTAGELLADRPGMRFGAGIRYEGDKLELLTCQRNMTNNFKIDRVRIEAGDRTQVMFINLAKARGELNVSSQSNTAQSNKVQNVQSESWNGFLQSPVKMDVNYMALSVKGIGSLPKWTDAIDVTTSAPIVLVYLQEDGGIKGVMKEFYATKITDELKN